MKKREAKTKGATKAEPSVKDSILDDESTQILISAVRIVARERRGHVTSEKLGQIEKLLVRLKEYSNAAYGTEWEVGNVGPRTWSANLLIETDLSEQQVRNIVQDGCDKIRDSARWAGSDADVDLDLELQEKDEDDEEDEGL